MNVERPYACLKFTGMDNHLFQLNEQIAWQHAGPGMIRQVFGFDDNIMMVKVKFETDAIGIMHQHQKVQVSYVESGEFELTIGTETLRLHKGDGYFVPPNVLHGCVCIEAGTLIDVFHPARKDFL